MGVLCVVSGGYMMPREIIEISLNGDPYGSGFMGVHFMSQAEYETGIGIYHGDIGAKPRQWWRDFCRVYGYILRYR